MNEPLSYEEVDSLVLEYAWYVTSSVDVEVDHASKCLSRIVDAFHPYILKWISVISGNNPNMGDPESIAFLTMFHSGNTMDTLDTLRTVIGNIERDELYNEILLRFIDVVMDYKPIDGVHFPGYLSSVFKYRMYRMACKYIIEYNRSHLSIEEVKIPDIIADLPDIEIDSITCLDDRERRLLDMYAYRGMSVDEIADAIGISRKTVMNSISSIRCKIRSHLEE